jgi:hypothetical protein
MSFSLPVTIPWVIALLVPGVGCQIIFWLLARRLRRAFPSIWDQLGRPLGYPSLFVSLSENLNALGANLRLMFFAWRRQHVDLGDHKITLLVWCTRIGYGLITALVAISFLDASPPRTIHFGM